MQFPSNPVPDKFAHDAELIAHRFSSISAQTSPSRTPSTRHLDRALQRAFGHAQQAFRPFVDHPDRNGRRGVAHPAILRSRRYRASRCRHIESAAGCRSRERSRHSAKCKCCRGKRDARADSRETRFSRRLPPSNRRRPGPLLSSKSPAESVRSTRSRISLAVRHACRIFSISFALLIGIMPTARSRREISAKTVSRSRFPSIRCEARLSFRKSRPAAAVFALNSCKPFLQDSSIIVVAPDQRSITIRTDGALGEVRARSHWS